MDIAGSYSFAAPPEQVWTLLMDPAVLSSCIPGCEQFEADGEGRYNVRLAIGLAAITGTYNGTVVLAKVIPQTSYQLQVEGQGRAGFVKGTSTIALRADGATTVVDVTAAVHTGGPIARLGQRLIGGAAHLMMDRFFNCLQSKVA
jgi:carbon monoxide dehydrogenase subunit G